MVGLQLFPPSLLPFCPLVVGLDSIPVLLIALWIRSDATKINATTTRTLHGCAGAVKLCPTCAEGALALELCPTWPFAQCKYLVVFSFSTSHRTSLHCLLLHMLGVIEELIA